MAFYRSQMLASPLWNSYSLDLNPTNYLFVNSRFIYFSQNLEWQLKFVAHFPEKVFVQRKFHKSWLLRPIYHISYHILLNHPYSINLKLQVQYNMLFPHSVC